MRFETLVRQWEVLSKLHMSLEGRHQTLQEGHQTLQEGHQTLQERTQTLQERTQTLQERHQTLQECHQTLQERHQTLQERHQTLQERHQTLQERHQVLEARYDKLAYPISHLATNYAGDYYINNVNKTDQQYWTDYNVTSHAHFASAAESLLAFEARNFQYPGYLDLMPVSGHNDKVILDYGCGPGHDLVGFAEYSEPANLIGIDLSSTSLDQARQRLQLHGKKADLRLISQNERKLPLDDESIDYIHCSGVLMLLKNPSHLLSEFRRILKPSGELRLMVYNYDSIWLHLYVAYFLQIVNRIYAEVSVKQAFSRTTDGEYCPFVDVYNENDMRNMAAETGFSCEFLGAAASLWELHLLPLRFKALLDPTLPQEHRAYLAALSTDPQGYPLYKAKKTGIDACYKFRPV
jgi:ubiquinone/menaquinone biosynthesis C-methylase UbiE